VLLCCREFSDGPGVPALGVPTRGVPALLLTVLPPLTPLFAGIGRGAGGADEGRVDIKSGGKTLEGA
jgi:hypothetical protein